MKTLITPNLIKFTLATLVLTVMFRIGLSTSITNQILVAIIMSAVVYAILMWLNGYYFGKKEHEYLPIYDIGFRFHLATFFGHNIISIFWFLFLITHLILYLFARKTSIKNLNKDDLFE